MGEIEKNRNTQEFTVGKRNETGNFGKYQQLLTDKPMFTNTGVHGYIYIYIYTFFSFLLKRKYALVGEWVWS